MSNVILQPDGYNHAHGFVRMRFSGTLGALFAFIVLRLHLPARIAIVSGNSPHTPDCTPGDDGIAAGVVG